MKLSNLFITITLAFALTAPTVFAAEAPTSSNNGYHQQVSLNHWWGYRWFLRFVRYYRERQYERPRHDRPRRERPQREVHSVPEMNAAGFVLSFTLMGLLIGVFRESRSSQTLREKTLQ